MRLANTKDGGGRHLEKTHPNYRIYWLIVLKFCQWDRIHSGSANLKINVRLAKIQDGVGCHL
jgi:hypothetical protein